MRIRLRFFASNPHKPSICLPCFYFPVVEKILNRLLDVVVLFYKTGSAHSPIEDFVEDLPKGLRNSKANNEMFDTNTLF